ncbi:MAG: deoxyribose-phosphate aldolase [Thermoflexales bacterium]|nr:deoxyribose-phosphate aldolase [Thermoflexales bacterium]
MLQQPLNRYIDHTLLKPDATRAQILQLCEEARRYQFASVCVNASWVKLCVEQLAGSGVNVCVTVGFPLGATTTLVKMFEAEQAFDAGAIEADMVINIGALKSGLLDFVRDDIAGVARVCHQKKGGVLKVILETALLTDEEKRIACRLAQEAGADFVKTCTGFNGGAATVEDVRLMRAVVGPTMGVKAAGGIRTYENALAMIAAGANRIGTSAGVAIMLGAPVGEQQSY